MPSQNIIKRESEEEEEELGVEERGGFPFGEINKLNYKNSH